MQLAVLMSACSKPGWLGFAACWLAVAPREFVADHIRARALDRVVRETVQLRAGKRYPSIIRLWIKFIQHYGSFLLVACAVTCAGGASAAR